MRTATYGLILIFLICGCKTKPPQKEPSDTQVQPVDSLPSVSRETPVFQFDTGSVVIMQAGKPYTVKYVVPKKKKRARTLFDFSKDKSTTQVTVVIGDENTVGDKNKDKSDDKKTEITGDGNTGITADKPKDNIVGDGNSPTTNKGLNPLWLLGLLVLIVALVLLWLWWKAQPKL